MTWSELDAALTEGRARDALRLAVPLWRETRSAALADLVDALAAFVDSDPRKAPPDPPEDPAELDAWLAGVDDGARGIFAGEWWTRDTISDLQALLRRFEGADDPRVSGGIMDFLLDPHHLRNMGEMQWRFVERLVELRDARARGRVSAFAETIGRAGRESLAAAIRDLKDAPPLPMPEADIVARGLVRYRDEPRRLIDLILDPRRERDDGTEQVASDALCEMGHPLGEAIALEYDQAAGIISAAGRERLATLLACHERRWLGRALFVATWGRVYRGGLLDEMTLKVRHATHLEPPTSDRARALEPPEKVALVDPRLARLRVLRADATNWTAREAEALRESPCRATLEELDVPSFEFLVAARRDAFPRLRRIRLDGLARGVMTEEWNYWAQPVAAWRELLPELREVVFRSLPSGGLEMLIEAMVTTRLPERIETFSLDGTRVGSSWISSGQRDPTRWFSLLDPHGVRRAALYYTDATLTVEWTEPGLVVTLETSEGGAAFDLLRRLPSARPVTRLVLRDFPGRRPKRLANLGRLRRILEGLRAAAIEMPVRWKNQLGGLPEA